MSDHYLQGVLAAHAVDTGPTSPLRQVQEILAPVIQRWGGQLVLSFEPSGSFAKGTAVRTGTDIDLFISLSSVTGATLAEIYETLLAAVAEAGYAPRRQDVSIGLRIGTYDVDLVPGKRQSQYGDDHSLYSNRTGTWLKTNVVQHITEVRASNRLDEIRLLKIWRNRRGLDFPSFFLELATIRALFGRWNGNLSANVVSALEFFRDDICSVRIADPANTGNIVSNTLKAQQKSAVAAAAGEALKSTWEAEFA